MQEKITELKSKIESLKTELVSLPSVQEQSGIEDLQAYIRLSTELLKAVAAFQVLKNVDEETTESESEKSVFKEIGTLESVITEEPKPEESVEIEEEPPASVTSQEPIARDEKPEKSKQESSGIEVAEMLANNAISDLRNAFGLNERFFYTNELFGGDGQEFVRAINEFNHLSSFEDAMKLIQAKYIPQFAWTADNEIAEEFVTIIKRRYS